MDKNNNKLTPLQKKVIAIFVGFTLPLFALECFLSLLPVNEGLHQLPVNDSNRVLRFEENRDFTWSKAWNFSIVTVKHSNNYGFLNDQNYSAHETTPLLAIIGDSYVEAAQVENSQAVPGLLAKVVGSRGRVYSFGISGMALPGYLMYAEYAQREFKPESMAFIIVGNDFDESLLKYERKPGSYHFVETSQGELVLKRIDFEPTLAKQLSRKSALLRYLYLNLQIFDRDWVGWPNNSETYVGNTSAEADPERVADAQKAVNEFLRQLPLHSGLETDNILLVVDGLRPNLYSETELQKAHGTFFDIMRTYFITQATEAGYEVIDMQPIFINRYNQTGARFEFEIDHHWNALGHNVVAEAITSSRVFSKTFNINQLSLHD